MPIHLMVLPIVLCFLLKRICYLVAIVTTSTIIPRLGQTTDAHHHDNVRQEQISTARVLLRSAAAVSVREGGEEEVHSTHNRATHNRGRIPEAAALQMSSLFRRAQSGAALC